MSEEKALNIYQKLQKARVEIQNAGVKKSGKNTFSHYDYFELSDFLPNINNAMEKYQLTSIFNFTKEKADLKIINTEKVDEKVTFETPVAISPLKGCNEMQNIGAAQSYARRYLYFMAFEIAENDMLDSDKVKVDEDKEEARKKINPVKISTIKELIQKTSTDEKSLLKYYRISAVENMSNEIFVDAMKQLQSKVDKMEAKQKTQTALEKARAAAQKNKNNNIPDLGI